MINHKMHGGAEHLWPANKNKSLLSEFAQDLLAQLLCLAEKLLVLSEEPVQFQRLFRLESLAQHHVAQVNRVGQRSIITEFFESGGWIVVIHGNSRLRGIGKLSN